MPISTGQGVMSIGKDVAVDIVLSGGGTLRLGNVTAFDAKPKVKKLNSLGIDGVNRNGVIPEGWSLSFDVDRESRLVDDWWAAYEEGYYNGETVQNVTVLETITEADGSISQWRYEGVALHYDDAGRWKSDDFVKQKITGDAAFKRRVQ
jgi:hypothetical protein